MPFAIGCDTYPKKRNKVLELDIFELYDTRDALVEAAVEMERLQFPDLATRYREIAVKISVEIAEKDPQ